MLRTSPYATALSFAFLAVAPPSRAVAIITPGGSFSYSIRLTGIDISSSLIPIVVTGPVGSAPGVDFDMPAPLSPPASGYVFTTSPTGDFVANLSTNPGSPNSLFLEIVDYTFPGEDPTAGSTDLISWITVTTAPTFIGELSVGFGDLSDFEILDSNGDDVSLQTGGAFRVQVTPGSVIPEPSSLALLGAA